MNCDLVGAYICTLVFFLFVIFGVMLHISGEREHKEIMAGLRKPLVYRDEDDEDNN